jgi:hypothetical protein
VLTAIRDAESRVRFLGYSVTQHKLFVFVLSAMIAGLAGALYVPLVGIINPGEFSPGNSIEAVVWVAFGGRGTLVGAVLGAFSVNALKTWLTSVAPDLWLIALGCLFVAVPLLLPKRPRRPVCAGREDELPKNSPPCRMRLDPGPVPGRRHRRLRRLQGAEQPLADRRAGELRAVIGPNGAGKTTMMDCITGKTRPTPAS